MVPCALKRSRWNLPRKGLTIALYLWILIKLPSDFFRQLSLVQIYPRDNPFEKTLVTLVHDFDVRSQRRNVYVYVFSLKREARPFFSLILNFRLGPSPSRGTLIIPTPLTPLTLWAHSCFACAPAQSSAVRWPEQSDFSLFCWSQ